MRTRSHLDKKLYPPIKPTVEHIYPMEGHTIKSYFKKFWWVHYIFKYKFLVPILLFSEWLLGDCIDSDVEDKWYNKNLIIWDKSWKQAMKLMSKNYNPNFDNPVKSSYKSYNTIRKLWNTMVLNDSATREFMNVFILELTTNIFAAYKGKKVKHVLYPSNANFQAQYYTFAKMLMGDQVNKKNIKKLEKSSIVAKQHIVDGTYLKQKIKTMRNDLTKSKGLSAKEKNIARMTLKEIYKTFKLENA